MGKLRGKEREPASLVAGRDWVLELPSFVKGTAGIVDFVKLYFAVHEYK